MSHHILVIEDNEEVADNICSILQLAQYKVTHAVNGKEGVYMAQHMHPDLVLCDIMMPELDGYTVVHLLSRDPATADIPFIFLTAKSDKADFRHGMNMGADDYITKPFDGADLLRVVEMRLNKVALLRGKPNAGGAGAEGGADTDRKKEVVLNLLENRHIRTFKKKDLVFMEGQVPNDLYHIEEGRVKAYKVNYDGKELITAIHGKGEYLGYIPLLEGKPYNENAEAMTEVRVSVIPKEEFLRILYSNRDVAIQFMRALTNNIAEMENRLLDSVYLSVRQRVASALLSMVEKYGLSDGESLITIARKDISSIVGTATESLNRTLGDFKSEGIIDITDHGLKIINKNKLMRIIR